MSLYRYRGVVTKVYDADTVTIDIDLGYNIVMRKQTLRLFGIDAWEVRGVERPEGLEARDRLRALILGREIIFDSHRDKKGKYGRWLASIVEVDGQPMNVAEILVNEGHAEWKEY